MQFRFRRKGVEENNQTTRSHVLFSFWALGMARGSLLPLLTVPMLSWPRRLGSNGSKRLGREARLPHPQRTLHDLMKQGEQADIIFMTKRSKVGQSRQDSRHEGPLPVIADPVQRAEQTHKDGAGGNFYRGQYEEGLTIPKDQQRFYISEDASSNHGRLQRARYLFHCRCHPGEKNERNIQN